MTTPHQEGEDSANFYQVGQMIECSNCHPEKYTGHQKTCNCKCHVPTTQSWEEAWKKANILHMYQTYGTGIVWVNSEDVKSFIRQTLATAKAEWKEKLVKEIELLSGYSVHNYMKNPPTHLEALIKRSEVITLINSTK